MSKADSPNDLDIIQLAIRNQLALVHTAIPAEVLEYDRVTQLADVQVLVRSAFIDSETGDLETYLPPPIPKVPVGWPSAGGASLTFPLAEGDQGILLVAERSVDEWKQTGGKDITPKDRRRFDLSDAFFLPMAMAIPNALPSSAVDATAAVLAAALVKLGDSGASDFVALDPKVRTELTVLETAITNTVIVAQDGGASFKSTLLAALSVAGWPSSVAATKVKAT